MKSVFNQKSRTTNVLKTSSVGSVCHLFSCGLGFVYRTVFIAILSAAYLGINGLFWNLLAVLSLAELGIAEVIVYRFYRPIAENDVAKVGQLMCFFKQVYRLIAGVVLAVGLALYPFINFFVKDPSSVPADVNLQLVYLLYLAQSVVSYLFVYRLTIWTADQKRYVGAFLGGVTETAKFGIQIITLWLTRDFTLTLFSGILSTLLLNVAFSVWTTRVYRPVFLAESDLPRAEKFRIFKDAGALMCHKLGTVVINNSDSIILSKFVGLISVGLYSNYRLLLRALDMILRQAIGGFAASFGNAAVKLNPEDYHAAFSRMQFMTLGVARWASACFCLTVDPLVRLWIGDDMVLARSVTVVLTLQFYQVASRLNVDANISATGLFVKDRPRPLIEAVLNLVISIGLVGLCGIVGVFVGTLASSLLTVFWRAPYILYRDAFKRSVWGFWLQFSVLTSFSVGFVVLGFWVSDRFLLTLTWGRWILTTATFAVAYWVLFSLCFCRMKAFGFFVEKVRMLVLRRT